MMLFRKRENDKTESAAQEVKAASARLRAKLAKAVEEHDAEIDRLFLDIIPERQGKK